MVSRTIYIYIDFDIMSKFRSILTGNYLYHVLLISYIIDTLLIDLEIFSENVKQEV